MENMILIMIDECGDEVEVDRYSIDTSLDEDFLDLWKSIKIAKASKRYPEARGFYFEDRSHWNSIINAMLMDQPLDDEWYDTCDDWSQNMPCDTYGPTACSTACPRYWECNK